MATTTINKNYTRTTPRLHIRPMRADDMPDIFECRSDPQTMQWATSKPETHVSQTHEWFRTKIEGNPAETANFSIELLQDGESKKRRKVIGSLGAVKGPEVGYMLSRAYHGKGYATEALRAFLDIFWEMVPRPAAAAGGETSASDPSPVASGAAPDTRDVLAPVVTTAENGDAPQEGEAVHPLAQGWDFAEAVIDPENKGSARVLVKCGFTLWSATRDDYESPNLGLRSTAIYRLARPGTSLGPAPGPFEFDMGPGLS